MADLHPRCAALNDAGAQCGKPLGHISRSHAWPPEEEPESPSVAVLMVHMPTRDDLRAMAEVGRQTEGRAALVSMEGDQGG